MSHTKPKVRTRFAPSPTGYLHVGGARTALFNYLYARAMKGTFIVRIEDTDVERSTEESYNQMLESLAWLGLDWDEGPGVGGPHESYRQSERIEIYREHAAKLVAEKKAYYCFCTAEELEIKKKKREGMGLPPVYDGKCRSLSDEEVKVKLDQKTGHTIRFKTLDKEIIVRDIVQGDVKFDTAIIGDFIIIKSNDYPSYNFAVVIDDHLMEINHVIRGVGHLSNTPRQILIYHAFDWNEPAWAHVSEIVGSDHKKLSKRHGATSITAFRDMGYPREAFINYMSLLGWSPPGGKEFMSEADITGQFDIARCSKSPAMFDVFDLSKAGEVELNLLSAKELENYLFAKSKLNWLSNQHIRALTEEEYLERIFPFVSDCNCIPENELKKDNENLKSILLSLRVYLDYLQQIRHYICDFYADIEPTHEANEWLTRENGSKIVKSLFENLNSIHDFSAENIQKAFSTVSAETSIKGKELFMTIRSAATGKVHGLELPVYLSLLGKKRVIHRLEKLI
ncbi:MAG: glutamate--tRNA ligase [Spirochaetia bacterium]|nr:glutamate--tRNA ligase [Spirochaetia bacterium]